SAPRPRLPPARPTRPCRAPSGHRRLGDIMRLLFAGTPDAALPSLRTLLDSHHEVVGVLTRPDAPSGRGRKLRPSPVKALALEAGVPVLTPSTLRDETVQQQIRDLAHEDAPVVAYWNLVTPDALGLP